MRMSRRGPNACSCVCLRRTQLVRRTLRQKPRGLEQVCSWPRVPHTLPLSRIHPPIHAFVRSSVRSVMRSCIYPSILHSDTNLVLAWLENAFERDFLRYTSWIASKKVRLLSVRRNRRATVRDNNIPPPPFAYWRMQQGRGSEVSMMIVQSIFRLYDSFILLVSYNRRVLI